MTKEEEIEEVKRQITTYFNVSIEQIIEKNLSRQVSIARNFMYYMLHVDCKMSFNALAKEFNRTSRDIIKRVSETKFLVENQKKYRNMYISIKAI